MTLKNDSRSSFKRIYKKKIKDSTAADLLHT